jgi:hypothetical protein
LSTSNVTPAEKPIEQQTFGEPGKACVSLVREQIGGGHLVRQGLRDGVDPIVMAAEWKTEELGFEGLQPRRFFRQQHLAALKFRGLNRDPGTLVQGCFHRDDRQPRRAQFFCQLRGLSSSRDNIVLTNQTLTRSRLLSDSASIGFKGSSTTMISPARPVSVPSTEIAIRNPIRVVRNSDSVFLAREILVCGNNCRYQGELMISRQ